MNPYDVSLLPPRFVVQAEERFAPKGRLWQSAPSAAQTSSGRIFCAYSADNDSAGEETSNYNICAYSDNGGLDFKLAFYVFHEHDVRISETLPGYEKVSVWQSTDQGRTLSYLGGAEDPTPSFNENTVYERSDGRLVMLFRTDPRSGGIKRCGSSDGGRTWSEPLPFILPGPSSRFMVSRFPSGALLIVTHHQFNGRNNLTALLSDDDGQTFPHSLLIDGRNDVSYPSGNIGKDGRVTLAYDQERTGAREILLASFTEEDIRNGSFGKDSYTKRIVSAGGKTDGV